MNRISPPLLLGEGPGVGACFAACQTGRSRPGNQRATPMHKLRPYPEYKDTGQPWLGKVPSHWAVLPAFAVFKECNQPNKGLTETQVLSLSYGRIIKKHENALHGLVPTSFETFQIIEPGNLILRLTDLQNDQRSLRVGLAKDRGIITSAYLCIEAKKRLLSEYSYYFFHSADVQKVFYSMGSGLRQSMGFVDLRRLPILIPDISEQTQIVNFLDVFNKEVDTLIRAKRRLIELLNEQKQVIIQRAVTRGIDPNVRLKPSGIPWLGEIPESWEVVRLRNLVSKIDQGISPQAEAMLADDQSWGVLKAGCVNGGIFRETEHKRLPSSIDVDTSISVRIGDVLVSRACGSPRFVGSVGQVLSLRYRLILSDKTFRLNFKEPRLAEFLVSAMNTRYFRTQVEQAISGAEGLANNLPLSALKGFRIIVPPIYEAEKIAKRLRAILSQINKHIETTTREIGIIREYSNRLMADAVTGKLDVRGMELPMSDLADSPTDWEDDEADSLEECEEEVDAAE